MPDRIELIYSNEGIFTFSVEDWSILRKEHRIIGEIIGNTAFIPALPVKILPEEALLLVEKEIVTIKEITNYNFDPTFSAQKIGELENHLLQSQTVEYKKCRKLQLESMIDKIVEKRRKMDDNRSPEDILNEELEKSSIVNKNNMIWPILMKPLDFVETNSTPINAEDISKLSTKLKCLVYRDLWEKGYYVTQGNKFGVWLIGNIALDTILNTYDTLVGWRHRYLQIYEYKNHKILHDFMMEV
ncbi:hypothetical protein NQ318_014035 [Aromia moschata]|uniref:TSEN34 N-terminal domain-containing protein n=1 Tax=Aromia moschata TaxID=1265417 RepID=A0AAV8Z0V0_9CUCU|nr:hypothetical protein NQ318_014035 [Aromia moschata]